MEPESIITISNLSKAFDSKSVLEEISLQLNPGENLVVLGKSGAGKTVLLKCMVGLLTPDKGNIRVFDTDVIKCNHATWMKSEHASGMYFSRGRYTTPYP